MGNKDKDKELHSEEGAMEEGVTGPVHDAHHASLDCSNERATARDKLIADALARNTAKLTLKFTALLNEKLTVNVLTALKVTSRAAGISAMPPFDWIRDIILYYGLVSDFIG